MLARQQQGFTLIELILVIIVTGIITIGIGHFITLGTDGYLQTRDREQLQSQARFAIERITREIRHAVPNSIALEQEGRCLSFMPIEYSGAYVSSTLSNIDKIDGLFARDDEPNFKPTSVFVINPTSQKDLLLGSSQAAQIDHMKKEANLGWHLIHFNGLYSFASGSSSQRFYTYTHKVEFCIVGDQLRRTLTLNGQEKSPSVLLAQNIDPKKSYFQVDHASLARSSLVAFQLMFSRNGENSRYNHTVQVMNAP